MRTRVILPRPEGGGTGGAVADLPAAGAAGAASGDAAGAAGAPGADDAAKAAAAAAAEQATADAAAKAASDAATAAAAAPKIPDTYTLKLPDAAALDASAIERTTAIARELGLPNDAAAQKVLDFVNQEAATTRAAVLAAHSAGDPEKNIPPGAEWVKQQDVWKAQALADPDIGAGKPEQFEAKTGLAMRAFAKFATPEFATAVRTTGFGSHPDFVRVFVKIGEAMGESALVQGAKGGDGRDLYALYPTMKPKD